VRRVLAVSVFSILLLIGCGGGGGGNKQPDYHGRCDYSVLNPYSRPPVDLVWYHNAQFNLDRTIRWPHRDVLIAVMDTRIDRWALQQILDEINRYIYPTRLVVADVPPVYADIEIWHNPVLDQLDWLGQCEWIFGAGNFLVKAIIEIADSPFYGCLFYAVLKHELLHAVGIFEHMTDGGVMNSPTYNDVITPNVIDVLVPLYRFPAGTPVYP